MKKISNWVFGSFFRTLGRILVYILIGYLLSCILKDLKLPKLNISNLLFTNVYAETFTQENRFQYYLYRNSDTPEENGTGLIDSYGGLGYNRVQYLYSLYTFDSNYLYDITFTTYFSGNGGTGVLTANIWAESCSIYTGSGSQYNCTYSGGYDGNQVYMRSSINNMVGTDLSSLWLNFYSSGVSAVNLLQNSYKLEINKKENKNVTSENLQNATDSIINNQNNNQQQTNEKLDQTIHQGNQQIEQNNQIIDGQNQIKDTLTDSSAPSNLDSLNNSAGWLPAGPVDSILNLPLSFLTNLNTNLSKSCQPVNLPLPFIDKTLPLPCVNLLYSEVDGLTPWINTVGIIASAFMLFGYLISLYKYVDDTLTFRENNYLDNWSGL